VGDAFEAIVGAARVERPAHERIAGARVAAVVRPATAEQVAGCLRAAAETRTAVVARGGGTKQHLGNALDADECAVLALDEIASCCELEPDEGIATLDAGVRLADFAARAAALGKTTHLPSLHAGATLGGTLAVDPVGPDWTLDRRARNEVLGIEVALANGELATAGGRVVKNVTGFDLARLYCGSFGTLGVITRATVRLRAAPERRLLVRGEFGTLENALASFWRAAAAAEPTAAAIVAGSAGAELLALFEGPAAAVALQAARMPADPAPDARWVELCAGLALPPSLGRARVRLAARPSDVADLCRLLDAAGARERLVLPLAGAVFAELPDDALPACAGALAGRDAIFFAERAPGAGPLAADVFGATPDALALMRALKARFDPQRVLAPGRFAGGL
jgi:glycolate oxidase FAD binding subunit